MLRTYDDCQAAARGLDKERKKGKKPPPDLYEAVFDSEHFEVGEYDRLEGRAPIKPEIWFLGAFPPCSPRPSRELSSFAVATGEMMAIPLDELGHSRLRSLKQDGKLKLHLQFRLVDVKMFPMPPYDAKACPGNQPAFSHDEVAPQVFIRAVKGWVESADGKRFKLVWIDDSGARDMPPQ